MTTHKLRNRLAGAASVGIAVVTVTMTLGAGAAFANPADPPGGATPVYPHFYNGNVDQVIRGAGSDTSFFLEQRISDLYNGSGLYGCTLNSAAGQTLFNSGDTSSSSNINYYCQANANTVTADDDDNWDKTEVLQGTSLIGSTAGQEQLCGTTGTPPYAPVDYARGAKPPLSVAKGGCSTEMATTFAKDGLPTLDFPSTNPSVWGAPTTSVYTGVNGGSIGPVAAGWLPGDPTSGPYNGTAWTSISNADGGGGIGSTAYRIFCAATSAAAPDNQIDDWGQLTNLGPKLEIVDVTTTTSSPSVTISSGAPEGTTFPSDIVAGDAVSGPGIPSGTTVLSGAGTGTLTLSNNVTGAGSTKATLTFTVASALTQGNGIDIGLPIRVVGVTTAAGVEATYASYASSAVSGGGGCANSMNGNSAVDPNPATAPANNTVGSRLLLQNNASQIADYAAADFPNDPTDQAIEIATSIYFESNGVYNTDPFAGTAKVTNTNTSTTISYTASKLSENGYTPTSPNLLNNFYPTAFSLSNIYRTDTVRASTAGFLNWICDANNNFTKGTDNSTGLNFDSELNTLITGTFGFVRLDDISVSPSNGLTPLDGLAAPNTQCASGTVTDPNNTALDQGNGDPPVTSVVNAQS